MALLFQFDELVESELVSHTTLSFLWAASHGLDASPFLYSLNFHFDNTSLKISP